MYKQPHSFDRHYSYTFALLCCLAVLVSTILLSTGTLHYYLTPHLTA